MNELVSSSNVIDAVLTLMCIEFVVLVIYHRRSSRGVAPRSLCVNLASGAGLLLALRALLAGAWWGWTAAFLAVAGAAHVMDLRQRWRRSG
jgi:hypothetical protein